MIFMALVNVVVDLIIVIFFIFCFHDLRIHLYDDAHAHVF